MKCLYSPFILDRSEKNGRRGEGTIAVAPASERIQEKVGDREKKPTLSPTASEKIL